jgi:hypothetical protein
LHHEHAEAEVREIDQQDQSEMHPGHREPEQGSESRRQGDEDEANFQDERAVGRGDETCVRQGQQAIADETRTCERILEHPAQGRPVEPGRTPEFREA